MKWLLSECLEQEISVVFPVLPHKKIKHWQRGKAKAVTIKYPNFFLWRLIDVIQAYRSIPLFERLYFLDVHTLLVGNADSKLLIKREYLPPVFYFEIFLEELDLPVFVRVFSSKNEELHLSSILHSIRIMSDVSISAVYIWVKHPVVSA